VVVVQQRSFVRSFILRLTTAASRGHSAAMNEWMNE